MRTSDFNYDLPPELIAQYPLPERDASRLLVLEKKSGMMNHTVFSALPTLLRPGDRLVFNDTAVYPSRLFCCKDNGVRIEFLFTGELSARRWMTIAKPAKRLRVGTVVCVEKEHSLQFRVEEILGDGSRIVSLESGPCATITEVLENYGVVPLPPYITRDASPSDRENYQTVYACNRGAIAAPTAGLHFTPSLIGALRAQGIDSSFITLHVGIGTFRPVKVEDPKNHQMHEEQFRITGSVMDELRETKRSGGRIIAVGTTVVRVLEHCAASADDHWPSEGRTSLLILPGYTFKLVDAIITNFHLPASTLLMLVAAFAGYEHVMDAYRAAVVRRYRFFSYGDAMFVY